MTAPVGLEKEVGKIAVLPGSDPVLHSCVSPAAELQGRGDTQHIAPDAPSVGPARAVQSSEARRRSDVGTESRAPSTAPAVMRAGQARRSVFP